MFPVLPDRKLLSSVDACASTRSLVGTMICAYMCCGVRCTVSRVAPISRIFIRVLRARRRRASFLMLMSRSPSFHSLAVQRPLLQSRSADRPTNLFLLRFFTAHSLAGVTHTFTVVRLGFTERTNLSRHLSDELFVDTRHDDLGLTRRFDLHAFRHVVLNRVRKAER